MEVKQGDMIRHERTGKLWAVDDLVFVSAKPPKKRGAEHQAYVEVARMHPIDIGPAGSRDFKIRGPSRTFDPARILG